MPTASWRDTGYRGNKLFDEKLGEKVKYFREKVIEFYLRHGRRFPWREAKDPYVVLISELLLQKTTSKQVLNVFNEFFSEFPSIWQLARADVKKIEEVVGVLGLRKRARFLKELALQIVNEFGGTIPKDRDKLLKLKGVGPYTANAVLAFAYGECVPVVDTNVARVIRRYFGLQGKKPAYADKVLWRFAEQIMPTEKCREYSYGLLDLAALVCKPHSPLCSKCPLSKYCHYYSMSRRHKEKLQRKNVL